MTKKIGALGFLSAAVGVALVLSVVEISVCVGGDETRSEASEKRKSEDEAATSCVWRVDGVEYRFDCERRRVEIAANGTAFSLEGIGVDFLENGASASEGETRCVRVERSSGKRDGASAKERDDSSRLRDAIEGRRRGKEVRADRRGSAGRRR